jgi:ribosomal protein S18 acetylase RimI-like enzyme
MDATRNDAQGQSRAANRMRIRHLKPADSSAFVALRRESLEREPWAFLASIEDDRALAPGYEISQDEGAPTIFGAFVDDEMTGVCGVIRLTKAKERHKAFIWGMYVRMDQRGKGIGAALLRKAVQHVRGLDGVSHLYLSVTERATAARRLYERHGFELWGVEPAGLAVEGQAVPIAHMVLNLVR